jgi:hypothetical protein
MLSATALPEKHQFMARAVKTAQSAIRFDPNANVLELHEVVLTGNEHIWKVSPINERSADCTWGGVLPNVSKGLAEEAGEFRLAHFAGSKSKLTVVDTAVPGGVTVDFNIIRWICDGIISLFAGHQPLIGDLVSGIAAKKQVRSGAPTVAGQFKVEIQVGQFLQLEGQDIPRPARPLGQLVVSKNECAFFCRVQVLDSEHGNSLESESHGGFDASFAGHHIILPINKDGIIESKLSYRLRDLFDLFFGVNARISRVQLEVAWSQEGNLPLVKVTPFG